MSRDSIRTDPRFGGDVERYHSWPTIHRQNVADHSWNVARILLAIYPDADLTMVIEALFHDIGEVASGDMPYGVKDEYPGLRDIMKRAEEKARISMAFPWGVPAKKALPEELSALVKLADLIEMWEWGLREVCMGNTFAAPIVTATRTDIMDRLTTNPHEWPHHVVAAALAYINKRALSWQT